MVQEYISIENLQNQINELKIENEKLKNKCKELENKNNNVKKKKKKTQSKDNKYGCFITLFQDVEKDKNKNVNAVIDEIKYHYDLIKNDPNFGKNEKSNKNIIEKCIDEIIKGKIKYKNNEKQKEGVKDSKSIRRYYRNKIKRSVGLYEKYDISLGKVYFSFSDMSRIYTKNWDEWLKYLNKFMEENKIYENAKII